MVHVRITSNSYWICLCNCRVSTKWWLKKSFLLHAENQLLWTSRNVSWYIIISSMDGENGLARIVTCCTATMDCSTVFKETPHLCLTQVVRLCVNLQTCPDRKKKQTIFKLWVIFILNIGHSASVTLHLFKKQYYSFFPSLLVEIGLYWSCNVCII